MPYTLSQPVRQVQAEYAFHEGLFSESECKQIIQLHKNIPRADGLVGGNSNGAVNEKLRVSNLYWINWENKLNWLFEKLASATVATNNEFWGFHLAGLNEALQLTHYPGRKQKGFYEWHEDHSFSPQFSHRKISGVVLLNDEFSGGKFEFFRSGVPREMKKGSLILFPSYKTHRVNKVTKGDRWSLVFWVTGPPFC
jgi:PKHD-type hydroxylase